MEESSNLASTARAILTDSSHEGFAMTISRLFMRQETDEYKSSKLLYDFFVANFPNLLTVQLLELYRSSSNGVLRFQSIYLLSENLAELRNRNIELSLVALYEIKPLLISCLTMQETKESDIKILGRIMSFVAYDVAKLDEGGWSELISCIDSFLDTEPVKAFHLFINLPLNSSKKVIDQFMLKVCKKVTNLEQARAKDLSLGLETITKSVVHLSDTRIREAIVKSVKKLVNNLVEKGSKEHVERWLQDLKKFVARNANLRKYSESQSLVLAKFAFDVAACYKTEEQSNQFGNEVLRVANKPEKYNHRSGFDRDWYDHLTNLSSVALLRIFASTDLEDRSRELAIRRLNVVLENTLEVMAPAHIAVMRELQPMLISCLKEEGLSDSMFKVLGEVVNHVAREVLTREEETWFHLVDYIASRSKTEFQRAVYIFQCMTMPLNDYEFFGSYYEKSTPGDKLKAKPTKSVVGR